MIIVVPEHLEHDLSDIGMEAGIFALRRRFFSCGWAPSFLCALYGLRFGHHPTPGERQ
jgi:hypothetical protein